MGDGLKMICKTYGGMTFRDNRGNTVEYAWDYDADEPVLRGEMPDGSERWKASERARWTKLQGDLVKRRIHRCIHVATNSRKDKDHG